jgi:ATP-dependent DNA ligase
LEHYYWAQIEMDGCVISVTTGTGFSEKGLKEAIDRLKPLFIDESPVDNPPKILEKIQWVRPTLVCK